jgi:hypothetical protein
MKYLRGSQQKEVASDDSKFCYCLQLLLLHSDKIPLETFDRIVDELLRLAKK